MPYHHTVEGRIVHVHWQGVITRSDLEAFGKDMPLLGRRLGFAPDVLHTFDETNGSSFKPIDAYHYSLQLKQVSIPNPIRAAIVATTPEGETLAAVFITLNRTPNLEMQLFKTELDARRWLARG
ncbi:MAG TPA: hypothetical protein VK163_14260 [Opitutaceae bacterium]|nr:hypothetical protein [Opitutaceae bacterium]